MYRFAITGTTRRMAVITVYVVARNKRQALDLAWDDMGLVCIGECRRVGSVNSQRATDAWVSTLQPVPASELPMLGKA